MGEKHLRFIFSLPEALVLILIYTQAVFFTPEWCKKPISLKEAFIAMEVRLFLGMILSWCMLVCLQQNKCIYDTATLWEGVEDCKGNINMYCKVQL